MRNLVTVVVTSATLMVYVIGSCCLARPADQEVTCQLGDEVYAVNATWHPVMNTVGRRSCVNCTCMQNGEVSCQAMSCPKPDCEEPRLVEGECCVSCDVGEDVIGRPGEGGGAKKKDCKHEGRTFRHLDTFPSNNTSLQPKNDSQCVICNCFDGKVICVLQLCLPNPKCKKLISVDDDCCKRCQEEPGYPSRAVKPNRRKRPKLLPKGACWWHRTRKENGSQWNPVVAGKLSCVKCSCKNGDVTCHRKDCPKDTAMTCAEDKLGGECDCKACPKTKPRKTPKGKGRKGLKKNKKKKRKRKKKKRKLCGRGKKGEGKARKKCRGKKRRRQKRPQNPAGSSDRPDPRRGSDITKQLCLPPNSHFVMYHTKGKNYESVTFVDTKSRKPIQDIRWKVKRGRFRGEPESRVVQNRGSARRDVSEKDIVGAVHKDQLKRFTNMLRRRRKRCKKPCRRKVLAKVVKKVKVTKVDPSKKCE